ncbi:MAG: uroporphyrinogen-III synthase [Crocinitomicaceae bacterium]|nr:uroporphyrinogen-III synthase [Crocinitomicaceae bacterium]
MASRVFISKNESEVHVLKAFLTSQEDILVAQSFLHFSQVAFNTSKDYDVIFFGSRRAVDYFLQNSEIPNSVQIACVGSKTAEAIQKQNREVAFIGDNAANIQEAAQSFKKWCGSKTVLFPISTISLKTFSSLFDENQKIEVEVYDTKIVSAPVPDCDTYVFTSPSNVQGFLESNELPNHAQVIAWGISTQDALIKNSIAVQTVLVKPSIGFLISELSNNIK